jgi:CTD nuclear envelope phosphatase 1
MRKVLVLDLDETLVHYHVGTDTVQVRPYAREFLRYASTTFDELVVFTAASKEYADAVVAALERLAGIRIRRRYYRESCDFRAATVKDLRMLNEPPSSRVLLLDNTPSTYSLQPQCGVAIADFRGDRSDRALLAAARDICRRVRIMEIVHSRE